MPPSTTVQIIYLLPFILISLVTGLICIVVPRWRRYAAAAVVAPMAFAVCSITGLIMTILLTEWLGISGALGFDVGGESQGWSAVLVAGAAYLLAGALGALVAVEVVTRLQRRTQFLGSGISPNGSYQK